MAAMEDLWKRYQEERDESTRAELIEYYLPLVKQVANRMAIGLPPHIDRKDLYSSGSMGLINAVERFDPQCGVKFETYGTTRIRGAILDDIRSLDWVPRSTRKKAHKIEEAYQALENTDHHNASDEDVAALLGISLEEFNQILAEVKGTTLLSLSTVFGDDAGDDGTRIADMVEDTRSPGPSAGMEKEEIKELLIEAISELPEQERNVLALYYYEELILKEIGQVLDISESRVSQIHTKSILRLRAKLSRIKDSLNLDLLGG